MYMGKNEQLNTLLKDEKKRPEANKQLVAVSNHT